MQVVKKVGSREEGREEREGGRGEEGRKEGERRKERFKKWAHPVAAQQRLISMQYFDFKLFLAWLLLYSLLHT